MHKLYELKDMLCEELEEYGSKEKLDVGALDIVDKLAHAIKNIDRVIEVYEEEMGGYSKDGGMYPYYDRGRSYAGRRRDSKGRYSRAESEMDKMVDELRDMMHDLPEDKKHEVQKFIDKIERM